MPTFNGAILTMDQIIKCVMSSTAEDELASLFITAKKCVKIRQTLGEMGWPKQHTTIQVVNTTVA